MNIKGAAILSVSKFIQARYPERYNEWLDALSPKSKAIYDRAILAGDMYPLYEGLIEPTQKICELFFAGNERGAWEAGRFSAEYALKGFYKVFFKLGSPGFIISRASRVFSSYYEESELRVVESTSNSCVLHIRAFNEPYYLLDMRIGGWMERALELMGCKNVRVKITRSLTKGDTVTEYVANWSE